MKRTLIVLAGVLLLSVGTIIGVSASIDKNLDVVCIEENVVFGDPSEVEGVTIYRNLKWEDVMYWDVKHVLGQQSQTVTEFAFHMYKEPEPFEREYEILEFVNPIENTILDVESAADADAGVEKALWELFEETENGTTEHKIIRLSDYAEYYEFIIHVDMEDCWLWFSKYFTSDIYTEEELKKQNEILEHFHRFFRVPVIEDQVYQIGVRKDEKGEMLGYYYGRDYTIINGSIERIKEEMPESDSFFFEIKAVNTVDTCYFTFIPYTKEGKLVDTSLIPGGYGIYSFKYRENTIDKDSLKLEYALNPSCFVNLELDEQEENLLIFHAQENQTGNIESYMTVLDISTMEEKQTLCYGTTKKENVVRYLWLYDDFMVVQYDYSKAVLLSLTEAGTYQLEFVVPAGSWSISGETYFLNSTNTFDYNEEKLLIAGENQKASHVQKEYYYNPITGREEAVYLKHLAECGFFLGVLDENGLTYYAEYDCSLDADFFLEEHCTATINDSLKVSWPEETP